MKITLDENAFMPERAHDTDAGLDLRATDFHGNKKTNGCTFQKVRKEKENDKSGHYARG